MFLRTRVLGLAIPFHCNFPEVNLRFYVRRPGRPGEPHVDVDGHKPGVVAGPPRSAFLAEGSEVAIHKGHPPT